MAGVRAPKQGPKAVTTPPQRPSFVLGSRPSTLYAPKGTPRASGDITHAPPRITQNSPGQRQYGKQFPAPFGSTGAYDGT